MKRFLLLSILYMAVPMSAMAQEIDERGFWLADPWWFPLLEIVGILVCLYALYQIRRTLQSLGGMFGEQVKLIQYAVVCLLVAFVFNAYVEIRELEGFIYDVVFELPMYASILFIATSTKRLLNVSTNR